MPPPPPPSPLPPHPPILLTVRFSTPHPDVDLDIPSPGTTPAAALKLLIRAQLPEPDARRRLRFIYRGRILDDGAALAGAIQPLPLAASPPRCDGDIDQDEDGDEDEGTDESDDDEDDDDDDDDDDDVDDDEGDQGGSGADGGGGMDAPAPRPRRDSSRRKEKMRRRRKRRAKGKEKAGGYLGQDRRPHRRPRIIINCAIGGDDPLTPAQLAAEKAAAHLPPTSAAAASTPQRRWPRPPRGLDRLLSAGLAPAEIAQLRAQFRAIQARRHTPDTMPSPDTMRDLEDAWVDAGAAAGAGGARPAATAAAAAAAPFGRGGEEQQPPQGLFGAEEAGLGDDELGLGGPVLDWLIRGVAVGFFFPAGAMVWVVREQGMLSPQWGVFVVFGLMLALATGVMRAFAGGGEWWG